MVRKLSTICVKYFFIYFYSKSVAVIKCPLNCVFFLIKCIFSVGRQINREDERNKSDVASSDDKIRNRENGDQLSERRITIKRYRHESRVTRISSLSDDSSDSPMVFHNYAKRRRFSETEDENSIR